MTYLTIKPKIPKCIADIITALQRYEQNEIGLEELKKSVSKAIGEA